MKIRVTNTSDRSIWTGVDWLPPGAVLELETDTAGKQEWEGCPNAKVQFMRDRSKGGKDEVDAAATDGS